MTLFLVAIALLALGSWLAWRWWQNLKDESVCDICCLPTSFTSGYLLTTTEVLSSRKYLLNQLGKFRPILKLMKTRNERGEYLMNRYAELAKGGNEGNWLACEDCAPQFEFDRDAARWSAQNFAPRDKSDSGDGGLMLPVIGEVLASLDNEGVTISDKRYYQCATCGAIHFKKASTLEIVEALGSIPSGGSTCTDCGTRADAADIYSGTLDLDAPDKVIDEMLANTENVSNDAEEKTWTYKGRVIRGPASRKY